MPTNFLHNFNTGMTRYGPEMGRRYYGPSLSDPRDQPPNWLSDPRKDFYEASHPTSNLVYAGAGVAALGAFGFMPIGKGKRGIDLGIGLIRGIEEYSPAAVFRTFQASNFLSQFETPVRQGLHISPTLLRENDVYTDYLARLIGSEATAGGPTATRLTTEGVTLRGNRLFFGQGEDVALRYASAIRTPLSDPRSATFRGSYVSSWLGEGWARTVGADVPTAQHFFTLHRPKLETQPNVVNPMIKGMPTQIIGGRTRGEFLNRWVSTWGTTLVGRFNRLLEMPFEYPPFKQATSIFPKGFLAVKPGTGGQMLGRLALKYGLGAPALFMGYQTADWALRESEIAEGTAFGEGLTVGLATMGVKANVLASEVASATGLQAYREAQESIAPGSTDIQKLMAFPMMGALGAISGLYGLRLGMMGKMQIQEGLTSSEARAVVTRTFEEFGKKGTMARLGRAITQETGLYARTDWVGNLFKRISEPAAAESSQLSFKLIGKIGPTKLAAIAGGLAGAALTLPFVPGALIPEKTPDELRAIYSGKEEIAVRRGRWWEFGRSAFEGNRVTYYRPHWYSRLRTRARHKGIFGDKEDELSPLEKWWTGEFTYELEKQHYRERPYPITGLPFEDVPLIGPVLAATVGRLIKPARLMHTEEWQGAQGDLAQPPRFGQRIASEIGETAGPPPDSPYTIKGTLGEQAYRFTEMVGLPGFIATSVKDTLTGTPELFDQMAQLESSRSMFGFEREYWDMEVGGGLGTTEFFRRLYPHRRRQIPLYNPIRNLMPEWLPGPGEKSPDFLHGDPYTKVPEGELRLPGRGYEARYPELEGLSPDEYPLIHKFKILADVSMYTDKFKEHLGAIRHARGGPGWTDREEDIFDTTMAQIKERKQKREFHDYEYLTPMGELFGEKTYYTGEDESGLLAVLNQRKADSKEEKGIFAKFFGGYWEMLAHNAETALDQVTPLSPGAKLVHMRTAIESYERQQLYGTENAFWSHPIRDFFQPSYWLGAKSLGYEGIPSHIQSRRNLEEYFDILKYVKNTRLANIARQDKDTEAVKEFEARKDQSLFGVNPFTRNYTSIFRALPRRERDYFNAFAEADTEEERRRVLEIVPENEKTLYLARWKLAFADELRKTKKEGALSESQLQEADTFINQTHQEAVTEGLPTNKQLFAEYIETRLKSESYADWYRRVKLLAEGPSVPGPDWVGWHPSVDLDDIKLKVVQTMGEDMHEYDLWPSRAQTLMNKTYVNDEAMEEILAPEELSRDDLRDRIDTLLKVNNINGSVFTHTTWGQDSTNIDVKYEHEPEQERYRRLWQ